MNEAAMEEAREAVQNATRWAMQANAKDSKLNANQQPPRDAGQILAAAAQTFEERKATYKDNFIRLGGALAELFPDGITLKTDSDFVRFHLLMLNMTKVSRYCTNFSNGGHQDSIHDAAVYAALLEAYDEGRRP